MMIHLIIIQNQLISQEIMPSYQQISPNSALIYERDITGAWNKELSIGEGGSPAVGISGNYAIVGTHEFF